VSGRTLRSFAVALAGLFFLATVFQLIDQLNLVVQPPAIPESTNLVDRVTALIPYRHDDWPIFLAANGLSALGFVALIGLGLAAAGRLARTDDRRHLVTWTLVTAGVLGAVGQLLILGAVKASIDIPYCDCGFKNEEIVSQVWAEMVAQGAAQFLIYAASLLAAGGLILVGRIFAGRSMPLTWRWLAYASAALLVLSVLLGYADAGGDATTWLTVLLTGIAIPAWALWLGLRFDDAASPSSV
jgi:hypothetical protein